MTVEPKRRTTIRDVAAEANVSISTVSLYVRGRSGVGDDTARRIAAAIEKLNYIPRPRSGANADSKFLGFLIEELPVPAFSDIFYGAIIRAMEATAKECGYGLLFSTIEDSQLPRMITEKQVRGLLILGGSPTNDAIAVNLLKQGIPLVLVDNYIPGLKVHSIVPDNFWGGFAAFKHLLDLGHERIAIIEGPHKYKTLVDRLQGALKAAEDHGVTVPSFYQQGALSSGRTIKGYLEMQRLLALPEPPTAVFAVSDKTAMGALQAIREAGLRIPADISIVGFDNVLETEPPLTTVNVPKYEIGRLAIHHLLEVVEGGSATPCQINVHTDLIIRDSTASR